jgi:glutamate N-acetyltransferase/amino-acid N-acetyltransferase
MASGAAKNKPIDGGDKGEAFRAALRDVLEQLGRQIVRDGEGAQHVVTIEVQGAATAEAADAVARRIAYSPLVRTAFFGADPNWGRILCAVGNSGVKIDPKVIDIAIGEIEVVRGGIGVGGEAERGAHEVMRRGEYMVRVHLHNGRATGRHTTCDLGVEYVKLNADYRS